MFIIVYCMTLIFILYIARIVYKYFQPEIEAKSDLCEVSRQSNVLDVKIDTSLQRCENSKTEKELNELNVQ